MTGPRQVFGQNLRHARGRRGLSQQAMERLTGVEQARISKIESGLVNPDIDTMNKLAEAVGMPMWELCKPGEGGADA